MGPNFEPTYASPPTPRNNAAAARLPLKQKQQQQRGAARRVMEVTRSLAAQPDHPKLQRRRTAPLSNLFSSLAPMCMHAFAPRPARNLVAKRRDGRRRR